MAADPKKGKDRDRETEAESEDEAQVAAGKQKKKKLLIMIGVGVLLMVMSIGGTLLAVKLFTSDSKKHVAEKSADESADEENADEKSADEEGNAEDDAHADPAIYFTMQPNFTVNFSVEGRQRYLQAEITLLYRNPEVDSLLKLHMPAIRNQLVMLLSTKSFDELQNPDSREKLKIESLQAIQAILDKENAALHHKSKDEDADKEDDDEDDSADEEKEPALVIEQVLFTRFVMQ